MPDSLSYRRLARSAKTLIGRRSRRKKKEKKKEEKREWFAELFMRFAGDVS